MIKKAWERWKGVAEKVGDFQATIIFSLFYFILITPFGLVSSLFKDSLNKKGEPFWSKIENNASDINKLREQ